MIKVIGSSKENTDFVVLYNQSARVLVLESSAMCDDCVPYEESTGCMVWLDQDKIPCEIECIFPKVTEALGVLNNKEIKIVEGTPKCKVIYEEKPIEITFNNSQLTLCFNKAKKANKQYITSNCAFYTCEDEIVAIVCNKYELI